MQDKIRSKAVAELKAFIERSGEDASKFIGKVQIFEDILTVDFKTGEETIKNEISIVLLAETPEGIKPVYQNGASYSKTDELGSIYATIEEVFPSKEEIEKAKKEAEEKAKAEQEAMAKMQEQLQKMDPSELAKAAMGQAPVVEDATPVNNVEEK